MQFFEVFLLIPEKKKGCHMPKCVTGGAVIFQEELEILFLKIPGIGAFFYFKSYFATCTSQK